MTIKQAYQHLQTDGPLVTVKMLDPMFDIMFDNQGDRDETQFTVSGMVGKTEIIKNLTECFTDFCKAEGIKKDCVFSITYMGQDMEA